MTSRPPNDDLDRVSGDFDDVARITQAVKRLALAWLVATPLWLLLLWALGRTLGIGVVAFVLASVVASGLAVFWLVRTGGLHPGERRPAAQPASAGGKLVMLGIAIVVLVFVLILLVASQAGG